MERGEIQRSAATGKGGAMAFAAFLALLMAELSTFAVFQMGTENAALVNNDLYYMVPTGRWILGNGIPHENLWTYVPGMKIVVQQWAWCVWLAVLYDALGDIGLSVAAFLSLVAFAASARWYLHEKRCPARLGTVVAVVACGLTGYIGTRPELPSLALAMVQLAAMQRAAEHDDARWLALVPAAVVAEMNLHAAMWPVHIALLVPWLRTFGWKRTLALWAASLLALLANPYGTDGIAYIVHSTASLGLQGYGSAVQELAPRTMFGIDGAVLLGVLAAFALTIGNRDGSDHGYVLTVAGTLLVCSTSMRNIMFLPTAAVTVWAVATRGERGQLVAGLLEDGRARVLFERQPMRAIACAVTAVLLALTVQGLAIGAEGPVTAPPDSPHSPTAAVGYMRAEGTLEGASVLAADVPYLEFEGCRPLSDSRPEISQRGINGKEDILPLLLEVEMPWAFGDGDTSADGYRKAYGELVSRYPAEYALVPDAATAFSLAISQDNARWRLAVRGDGYALYERTP